MSDPKPAKPKSRVAGCLAGLAIPLAVLAWMAFDTFVLTRFTAPQQHAERTTCIGPVTGEPKWQNTCDETLNFTYCLIGSDLREVCRLNRLAPGQGVTDIDGALAELGVKFVNMRRIACAEPFTPVRVPHKLNGRLQDECG